MKKITQKKLLLIVGTMLLALNMNGQELITDPHFQKGAKVFDTGNTYQGDIQPFSISPTDADGNTYSSVTIGETVWMTENFKSTKFNDGSSIGTVKYHPNDPDHEYGPHYSWNDVVNPKFAPLGWHVPTNAEWRALFKFAGNKNPISGKKIKEQGTAHWNTDNGTDDYGFKAIGTGHIYGPKPLKTYATWWTATEANATKATRWWLNDNGAMGPANNNKPWFFPVRLVKDKPHYKLAQWNSQSDIYDATPDVSGDGWYTWKDNYKEIQMGPEGVMDYDLLLGVDGNAEFGGVYRGENDPWPHLLVQQQISSPGFEGPGCPPLDQVTNLHFKIEAKLVKDDRNIGTGYDDNIHAADFRLNFTVQNLNKASAGYGDYLWLAIPIYDDRTEEPAHFVKYDKGSKKMIYSIAYNDVASETTHNKTWVNFDLDLLPHVKAALQAAWDNDYLQDSQDLADYKIGTMNIGWEVTGLNTVDMELRNLSLVADDSALGVNDYSAESLKYFKLEQNYPNPAVDNFTVKYIVSKAGNVKLSIYDYTGREIKTLVNEFKNEGSYEVQVNVEDYASGLYFGRLSMGNLSQSVKILINK